ncbi:pyridoxal phosphate-dependent enzyme, beta subunit [Aspergillus crustosus]
MSPPPTPVTTSLQTIGNTPVLHLHNIVPKANHAKIFLKIESTNPTGSYKDRMAKAMIEQAEPCGALKPGMTVSEATGGSTGSSLAFICAVKGYKFYVITSNAYAVEKTKAMRVFGTTVKLLNSPSGKITPGLFEQMSQRAREIVEAEPGRYYYTDQFNNQDALPSAGMVMGVSQILRAKCPKTKIVVLEPASSPLISEGRKGIHGVDGVSPGFVPPHLDNTLHDEAREILEEEGRAMCRRLAREEGVLEGISTGLNVVAAIQLAKELGPGKMVVTGAVIDSGLKYLNGRLLSD